MPRGSISDQLARVVSLPPPPPQRTPAEDELIVLGAARSWVGLLRGRGLTTAAREVERAIERQDERRLTGGAA